MQRAPSPREAEFNAYFTEQVVGSAVQVAMGPRAGLREVADRGVRLGRLLDDCRLVGQVARSVWARSPAAALAGQPLVLAELPALRRRVLLGGLLLWSAALGSGVWALLRWLERA